jgi:hypothetical protein
VTNKSLETLLTTLGLDTNLATSDVLADEEANVKPGDTLELGITLEDFNLNILDTIDSFDDLASLGINLNTDLFDTGITVVKTTNADGSVTLTITVTVKSDLGEGSKELLNDSGIRDKAGNETILKDGSNTITPSINVDDTPLSDISDANITISEGNEVNGAYYLGESHAPDYNYVLSNTSADALAYVVLYEYDYSQSDLSSQPTLTDAEKAELGTEITISGTTYYYEVLASGVTTATMPIDTTDNKYDGKYIVRRVVGVDKAGNMLESTDTSETVSSLSALTAGTTSKLTHYVDTLAPRVTNFVVTNDSLVSSLTGLGISDTSSATTDILAGSGTNGNIPNVKASDELTLSITLRDANLLSLAALTNSETTLSTLSTYGISLNTGLFEDGITLTVVDNGDGTISLTVKVTVKTSPSSSNILSTDGVEDKAGNKATTDSGIVKSDGNEIVPQVNLDTTGLADADITISEGNEVNGSYYLGESHAPDYNYVLSDTLDEALAYVVLYAYDYSNSDLSSAPTLTDAEKAELGTEITISNVTYYYKVIEAGSTTTVMPIDTTNNKYDGKYIVRRVVAIDSTGNMLETAGGTTTVSSLTDLVPGTTSKLTHYVDTIAPNVAEKDYENIAYDNATANQFSLTISSTKLGTDSSGLRSVDLLSVINIDGSSTTTLSAPSDTLDLSGNVSGTISHSSITKRKIYDVNVAITDNAGNSSTFSRRIYLVDTDVTVSISKSDSIEVLDSSYILKSITGDDYIVRFSVYSNYEEISSVTATSANNQKPSTRTLKVGDKTFTTEEEDEENISLNLTDDYDYEYHYVATKTDTSIADLSIATIIATADFGNDADDSDELNVDVASESDVPVITDLVITNNTLRDYLTSLTDESGLSLTIPETLYTYETTGTVATETVGDSLGFRVKDNDNVTITFNYSDDNYKYEGTSTTPDGVTINGSGLGISADSSATETGEPVSVSYTFTVNNDDVTANGDEASGDHKQVNVYVSDKFNNSNSFIVKIPLDNTKPSGEMNLSRVDNTLREYNESSEITDVDYYINADGGNSYNYELNPDTGVEDVILFNLAYDFTNTDSIVSNVSLATLGASYSHSMGLVSETNANEGSYSLTSTLVDKAGNIGPMFRKETETGTKASSYTRIELNHIVDTIVPTATLTVSEPATEGLTAYKEGEQVTITLEITDKNLASSIMVDSTTYYTLTAELSEGSLAGLSLELTEADLDSVTGDTIKFVKTLTLDSITGDEGSYTISSTVQDLALNSTVPADGSLDYSNSTPSAITLDIKSKDIGSGAEDGVYNLNDGVDVLTRSNVGITISSTVDLSEATLTLGDSSTLKITNLSAETLHTFSDGLTTAIALTVKSTSGLETTVSADDALLTINEKVDSSLSEIKILTDGKINTSPVTAGRVSVSYDSEKSGDDKKIYAVTFNFTDAYDYTDIYKIILDDIKIKGDSAEDLLVSFDGSIYDDLSGIVETTSAEMVNSNVELDESSEIGAGEHSGMFEGFSATIYVDVTNNLNFIGSRVTFEVDVVDGLGNTWSSGNSEIEYDATFPKQGLILRGRQSDSKREKKSTIQVVGDGSGSKFDIESVIEAGQE